MTSASAGSLDGNAIEQGAPPRAWLMVAIFLLFFVVSHIDRSIINMMVQPIERDLGITDFQMSLLLGPAFGVFYVLCGLPLGWVVDRFPRGWVTAMGVAIWGTATAICGMSSSYLHLFFARMGVGVGESTLTPAAHSLIADTFPRRQLSTALSIYALGAIIGSGLAMVVGGMVVQATVGAESYHVPLLGELRSWQLVFLSLGICTLALLPLTYFLREGGEGRARQTHESVAAASEGQGLIALVREHAMFFLGMPMAFGLVGILANAYGAWVPTFMMREYGLNPAQVGLGWGLQHVVAGVAGQVVSVLIVDRLYQRGYKDAHLRYPLIGLFVSAPFMVLALNASTPTMFLVLSGVFYVLTYSFFGYASAGLQLFTPSHLRGRMSAIFLTVVTLVGVGLGAPLTGLFTEFLFQDKGRVGDSLALVTLIVAPLTALNLWLVARKVRRMHADLAGKAAA